MSWLGRRIDRRNSKQASERFRGTTTWRTFLLTPPDGLNLESYVENLQKEYFEADLRRTNGVQVRAAELLGLPYRSFRHYMQKFNIKTNSRQ